MDNLASINDIKNIKQELDLWTGEIKAILQLKVFRLMYSLIVIGSMMSLV